MDINMDQLRNLYNPEQSFMGQVQKQDAASAAQEQMLAQAAQMRQAAAKSAAMLPAELNKANYENSDAVRGADMQSKKSLSGYHDANAASIWSKLDSDKQTQIVKGVMDGHRSLAQQGMAIAQQGGGGKEAYVQAKNMLQQQIQAARTPEDKQRYTKALEDFELKAQQTNMQAWDSNELRKQSSGMLATLDKQDPELIKENLKGAWKMKEIGAQGANQIAVANIGATSRNGIAAGKAERTPRTAEEAEVKEIQRQVANGILTYREGQQARAAILAGKGNPNRIAGSSFVPGENGKLTVEKQEKVPAYAPIEGKSDGRTVVATGTNKAGKKVVKYSDGSIEEAK